jgi:hypothetical protein
VVVVDRLVADSSAQASDQPVGGVASEGEARPLAAEVGLYRLADQLGDRHAVAPRAGAELSPGFSGEAEVGGHMPRHRGITIPHCATDVKGPAELFALRRFLGSRRPG